MSRRFRYRAAGVNGTLVRGRLAGPDETAVIGQLHRQGMCVITIAPDRGSFFSPRPIPAKQLAVGIRGLATLIAAGTPVDRALAAVAVAARRPVAMLLGEVGHSLANGQTLASCFGEHEPRIPAALVGQIAAAERTGKLAEGLAQAAAQLESEAELRSRIRHALAYPLVLVSGGLMSMGIIVTTVIPSFAALLGDLGQDLPMVARFVLQSSQYAKALWPLGPLLVVTSVVGWRVWLGMERGTEQWHRLLLELPGIGRLRYLLGSARVTRALGSGLEAGLPLMAALSSAEAATADHELARRVRCAADRIRLGQGLSSAFREEAVVTPESCELLAIGDQSGRLGEFAFRAATQSSEQAERGLKTLINLLEPSLVVLFGGFIAIVAAALLQAVYAIRPGIP